MQHFLLETRAAHRRLHRRRAQVAGRYRWPGNVRELQNVVEQPVWMSNGEPRRGRAPAAVDAQRPRRAGADARAPPAGRRRLVRRARIGRLLVLGAHLPDVSGARHHAARLARARAARPARRRGAITVRCFGCSGSRHRITSGSSISCDARVQGRLSALPARHPGAGAHRRVLLPPLRPTPVAEPGTTDSQAGASEETADASH